MAAMHSEDDALSKLNVPYTVCETIVAVVTVAGNTLVLVAFKRERKLRRRTNYYIVSLAVADLLVGLIGIPCAIFSSVGLPKQLHACLLSVSLLVVLCTISIFSLVAVSVDRYWAILHPMSYSRIVNSKFALGIICLCWIAGCVIGFLPLFGWNMSPTGFPECIFTKVMDYNYLVFLYFATIVFPALLLAAFYSHIYNVILKQLRQMVAMNETTNFCNRYNSSTTMNVLSDARRKEVKATQNLSVIVLFFILCWMPLYTINCIQAFCESCGVHENVLNVCIILSHLNSAGNPLLYAYRLSDFRNAFRCLLFGTFNSSAENVIVGRADGSDCERSQSHAKRHPHLSISFSPRKYKLTKSNNGLFKFNERENGGMRLADLRKNGHFSNLCSNDNYYAVSTDSTNCNYYTSRATPSKESNYAYCNSEYIGDPFTDFERRRRVHSTMEEPSYVLMVNDDEISQREQSIDNSPKEVIHDSKRRILRRHSTNT